LLRKIQNTITQLFQDRDAADEPRVSTVDPRTRRAVRAALSEVGYTTPGSRRAQPLLYRELNRRGERIWRAA
jgi:hypothetical protein